MSKNTEIKFVGQPIFKQVISLFDVFELLRSTKREYLKQRGSPGSNQQTSFAF